MTNIEGHCDPKFEPVRDAFARCFSEYGDVGASACFTVEGDVVVDLWGGHADANRTRRWERDTLCVIWSATKGVVATAVHMLVDRGMLDIDVPIATYWPEYGQAGKEAITLRQVMSQTAGVPFIDAELPEGAAFNWEMMVDACARQAPEWVPGTRLAYHAATFGWIVGEVIRRVSGEMPGDFIAREIAEPLGADFVLWAAGE